MALEAALNDPKRQQRGPHGRVRRCHVQTVVVESSLPFYGFTERNDAFARIDLLDPSDMKRAALLLESGAVLGKRFQPHNAHFEYFTMVSALPKPTRATASLAHLSRATAQHG